MQNLTIDRQCRVFTSKGHELDQRAKLPLRIFSPVTGATLIVRDREALAAFLQDHIDAVGSCFTSVAALLEWMLEEDVQIRVAVSQHDAKVRQMIDPACIYL